MNIRGLVYDALVKTFRQEISRYIQNNGDNPEIRREITIGLADFLHRFWNGNLNEEIQHVIDDKTAVPYVVEIAKPEFELEQVVNVKFEDFKGEAKISDRRFSSNFYPDSPAVNKTFGGWNYYVSAGASVYLVGEIRLKEWGN